MTTTIRIDDKTKWQHEIVTGAIRVFTKEYFSIDINSLVTINNPSILVTNDAAYKLQILNILGTPVGSEEGLPEYGSDIYLRLFEPINNVTANLIEFDTITALRRWMKHRLRVVQPGTYVSPHYDEEAYEVNIRYELLTTRVTSEFNFKLVR